MYGTGLGSNSQPLDQQSGMYLQSDMLATVIRYPVSVDAHAHEDQEYLHKQPKYITKLFTWCSSLSSIGNSTQILQRSWRVREGYNTKYWLTADKPAQEQCNKIETESYDT